MLFLFVKGRPAQARQALRERNMEVIAFNREGPGWGTQVVIVENRYLDKATDWLCEQPPIIEGYGLPPGSLLFVRAKEDILTT